VLSVVIKKSERVEAYAKSRLLREFKRLGIVFKILSNRSEDKESRVVLLFKNGGGLVDVGVDGEATGQYDVCELGEALSELEVNWGRGDAIELLKECLAEL